MASGVSSGWDKSCYDRFLFQLGAFFVQVLWSYEYSVNYNTKRRFCLWVQVKSRWLGNYVGLMLAICHHHAFILSHHAAILKFSCWDVTFFWFLNTLNLTQMRFNLISGSISQDWTWNPCCWGAFCIVFYNTRRISALKNAKTCCMFKVFYTFWVMTYHHIILSYHHHIINDTWWSWWWSWHDHMHQGIRR